MTTSVQTPTPGLSPPFTPVGLQAPGAATDSPGVFPADSVPAIPDAYVTSPVLGTPSAPPLSPPSVVRFATSPLTRASGLPLAAASAALMAGCGSAEASPWMIAGVIAAAGVVAVPSLVASAHVLTNQRNPGSAFGWLLASWIPVLGPLLWLGLGMEPHLPTSPDKTLRFWHDRYRAPLPEPSVPDDIPDFVPEYFRPMLNYSRTVSRHPLLGGHEVRPLLYGEEAYPEMLRAIDEEPAGGFVHVGMFVFENNGMGRKFAEALKRAHDRGVEVRVIVDKWGALMTIPTGYALLKEYGLPVIRFNPPPGLRNGIPWNIVYHGKYLLTSRTAFVSSMNIGDNYMIKEIRGKNPHQDLNFLVRGPVLPQLERVTRDDWRYLTDGNAEEMRADAGRYGEDYVRLIRSSPDQWFETFKKTLIGALRHARQEVRITTAYFAPDEELLSALEQAALSGVAVEILLSEDPQMPFIDHGSMPLFERLIRAGVKLWRQPPPFDHTKFVVVDGFYVLEGSSNLGHRYLSGNFEVNLEIYSKRTARYVTEHFDRLKAKSSLVTPEFIASWTRWERIRNGLLRLVSWLY